MTKLSGSLFTATLCVALAAVFADAQPAAKPETKPNAQATPGAAPAASGPVSDVPACNQPNCSAGKAAPGGPHAGGKAGMMHGGMMHGGMQMKPPMEPDRAHRWHEIASLADVKVQKTKFGAVIQLTAKKGTDTATVQELATVLAAQLTAPPPRAGH